MTLALCCSEIRNFEVVPSDPNREEYRQGNTMGTDFRHWRRAKIGRRFRWFFRFDSRSRIIIFAWVNDENTLLAASEQLKLHNESIAFQT